MKAIFSIQRIHTSSGLPEHRPADDTRPASRRLSLADRVAFTLLAVGLLALGGVLLAAGLAILVALAAGAVVVGAVVVARHHLRGGRAGRLSPGELPATASVLPPAPSPALPQAPPTPPSAPRGD